MLAAHRSSSPSSKVHPRDLISNFVLLLFDARAHSARKRWLEECGVCAAMIKGKAWRYDPSCSPCGLYLCYAAALDGKHFFLFFFLSPAPALAQTARVLPGYLRLCSAGVLPRSRVSFQYIGFPPLKKRTKGNQHQDTTPHRTQVSVAVGGVGVQVQCAPLPHPKGRTSHKGGRLRLTVGFSSSQVSGALNRQRRARGGGRGAA